MKDDTDFLLAEYDNLKKEILALAQVIWNSDKLSITLSAAIWVWIFSHKIDFLSKLTSILPLIICVSILIYKWLLWRDVKQIGEYLKKIEDTFLNETNSKSEFKYGWENYLLRKNKDKLYYVLASFIWGFQIVINVIGIVYVFSIKGL